MNENPFNIKKYCKLLNFVLVIINKKKKISPIAVCWIIPPTIVGVNLYKWTGKWSRIGITLAIITNYYTRIIRSFSFSKNNSTKWMILNAAVITIK